MSDTHVGFNGSRNVLGFMGNGFFRDFRRRRQDGGECGLQRLDYNYIIWGVGERDFYLTWIFVSRTVIPRGESSRMEPNSDLTSVFHWKI